MVKRLPAMQETGVRSLGPEDPLEKEMATHSSTLAWKMPWTGEPGRWATANGVAKSRTRLRNFPFLFLSFTLIVLKNIVIYLVASGLCCIMRNLLLWCMDSRVVAHGLRS